MVQAVRPPVLSEYGIYVFVTICRRRPDFELQHRVGWSPVRVTTWPCRVYSVVVKALIGRMLTFYR